MSKELFMNNQRIRYIKSLFFLMIFLFVPVCFFWALEPGEAFPSFAVVSGDGKILLNADLAGRNILLFYEDRTKLDMNQELKNFLRNKGYNDDFVRIVVIADCANAGLRKAIWENSLIDVSRKSGTTVYGDWNGRMKQAIHAASDTSSFYILNQEGVVQYCMEGVVPEREFEAIHTAVAP
jgi:hypothetical protein